MNKWHYITLAVNIAVAAINIILAIFYGVTLLSFITAWVCFMFAHAILCFCNVMHNYWQNVNKLKVENLHKFIEYQQQRIRELEAKDEMGKEK